MIIIGVTGSIGMGKTTVSSMLRFMNIPVFDSDREVKIILEKNYEIIEKIYKIWPKTIYFSERQKIVDKSVLSDIIFNDPGSRKKLEDIIHPIIKNERDIFLKKHDSSNIVGLDVPLLYETGTDKMCDYIFLVNTSKKIQKKRVLSRKNMTENKFNLINNTQWDFERKKKENPLIVNTSFGKAFSFFIILVYLMKIIIIGKNE